MDKVAHELGYSSLLFCKGWTVIGANEAAAGCVPIFLGYYDLALAGYLRVSMLQKEVDGIWTLFPDTEAQFTFLQYYFNIPENRTDRTVT
jgi:hypothetical protein